jgi:MFS family permease
MSGIKSMIPALSRTAWVILGGELLSALGTGLTFPFLIVYLHSERGIDLAIAGLVLSALYAVSLAGSAPAGWLVDRLGARYGWIVALVLCTLGSLGIAFASTTGWALGAVIVLGLGGALLVPAEYSLLATVVAAEHRSAVFSLRSAVTNAGIGLGALTSAAIVAHADLFHFQLLYFVDAASYLSFVFVLLFMPGSNKESPAPDGSSNEEHSGYHAVLRDRVFLRVCLIMGLCVTLAYSQYQAAFPVYVTRPGGPGASTVSIALAANTAGVVLFQLLVLRIMSGRRRTQGIILACFFFSLAWAITLAGGAAGGQRALAIPTFCLAMIVFAVGETLISLSVAPIVNDLAPDHLRGRYNGIFGVAWTGGYMLGPLIAGLALARGQADALFLGFIACFAVMAAGARRLERFLPVAANRVGGAAPAGSPTAEPEPKEA